MSHGQVDRVNPRFTACRSPFKDYVE